MYIYTYVYIYIHTHVYIHTYIWDHDIGTLDWWGGTG